MEFKILVIVSCAMLATAELMIFKLVLFNLDHITPEERDDYSYEISILWGTYMAFSLVKLITV